MWFTDSLPASQAPGNTNTLPVITVAKTESGTDVTFGSVRAIASPVAKKMPNTRNGTNERQWRNDALVASASKRFCSSLPNPANSGKALALTKGGRASEADLTNGQRNAMLNVTAMNTAEKCSKKSFSMFSIVVSFLNADHCPTIMRPNARAGNRQRIDGSTSRGLLRFQ